MNTTIIALLLLAVLVGAVALVAGMRTALTRPRYHRFISGYWVESTELVTRQSDGLDLAEEQLTDPLYWRDHPGRMPGDTRPDPMSHCCG